MTNHREAVLGLSRLLDAGKDVPTRYADGTPDGFGDRLFVFEDDGAPTWEALRLRQDFAAVPGVYAALHARLEQLAGLDHPSFPTVKIVEAPGKSDGVLLMSAYSRGRRLSELKRARSAAFAMLLIRDLTLPLAALHKMGENVSHGSLTMDRILVAPDGRLLLRDHVMGAVLDELQLTPTQLWSDLGILRPTGRTVASQQLDVIDVALVALACILGRSIGRDDYSRKLKELVDTRVLFPPLRQWLAAAVDVNAGLSSAEEATDAIRRYFPARLPGESAIRASLAIFGRKAADLRSSPHGLLGIKRLWEDEGGTSFLPVRGGHA